MNVMELIKIDLKNIKKAQDYLASIGKLEEFNQKGIVQDWSAVIRFSNRFIYESNNNNKNELNNN